MVIFQSYYAIVSFIYLRTGYVLYVFVGSPDKKHTAHEPLLARDEIHLMRQRIEIDRRDYVPDTLEKAKLYKYLTDMNLWAYALLALCANMYVM